MTMCYCGSGIAFAECCEPYLTGSAQAPTAEKLMRARYSAYASGQVDFVHDTMVPEAREGFDRDSAKEWSAKSKWLGIEVLNLEDGTEKDDFGIVEFVARYTSEDTELEHHEIAEFKKVDGQWFFVDGRLVTQQPIVRESAKVGRNDPCVCGSGKKYKKCCGR